MPLLHQPLKRTAVIILSVILYACGEPPPADEVQLRGNLEQMVTAIENRDMDDFSDPIAADFTARNMDRRVLRWMVRRNWQRHQNITIQIADVDIQLHDSVSPPRATVTFHALLSGGDWLPRDAGWYRLTTGWRKDGDELWQLINADWEKKL